MKLLSLSIDGKPINPPASLPQPGTETVEKVIRNSITLFITVGIIVTLLVIVWAGIQWITSGGDKQKIASAKARLTWAIIGLIIILISFLIVNVFGFFFGIKLLS